jgi:hypothetical protein
MNLLGICVLVQISLAFGVAGLLWPEKLRPIFDVLMFPWAASYRLVRAHCIVAIAVSVLIIAKLFAIGF